MIRTSLPPSAARNARTRPAPVTYTDCDRVIYPDAGITKGDVLAHYRFVAPFLLPWLKERPVVPEYWPDGIGPGVPHFLQRRVPPGFPKWIRRIKLRGEDLKPAEYLLVDTPQALLYLVDQGALTFHTWLSRVCTIDRPDVVLFELEPGRAPFDGVVATAQMTRAVLAAERIPSFVKSSGVGALQVLAPWRGEGDFEAAYDWAEAVASVVASELPDAATTAASKPRRGTRVYVDVSRNLRGQTMVAPYVLRPVPEASVSMPLFWTQVRRGLDPAAFNLRTVPHRLTRRRAEGRNPFRGLLGR